MKDNKLTLLLHIIKSNGNINKLVREGVSFKEITNLTNNAIEKGYLTYENERIFVVRVIASHRCHCLQLGYRFF